MSVTNVAVSDIKQDTFRVKGINVPDPEKARMSLTDRARLVTIERRILAGARKVDEVLASGDREFLESFDASVEAEFETKRPVRPTPTLADDLLFGKTRGLLNPRAEDRAKTLLRSARRFVLTDSAARRIAEAIRQYPDMLVEQGWFARTPFETCWIELPARPFHSTIAPGSDTPDSDDRIGYLFHGSRVYVGASNESDRDPVFSPLIYHLHHPNSLADQLSLAEDLSVSRGQLDNFYWGQTMAQGLSMPTLRGLRGQHGFEVAVEEANRSKLRGMNLLGLSAGEIRNIVGLLLMINQPSGVVRIEDIEHRRTLTSRGNRLLMGHSVVTLNLDRRSKVSRLLRKPVGSHASPRWHAVMDHWCHDRVARTSGDHTHDWDTDDAEGRLVARCRVCGGRRWRRRMKNGRGDRARGIVSQDRIVATDNDRTMINEARRDTHD
jgi:hypothetical protein